MNSSLAISARCIAAIFGGYAVSALFSLAYVPMQMTLFNSNLADAILIATMLSYIVYIAVFIDCFCRSSAIKSWRNIFLLAGVFSAICWFGVV